MQTLTKDQRLVAKVQLKFLQMKSVRILTIVLLSFVGSFLLQNCLNEAKAGQTTTTPAGELAWNKIQNLEKLQQESPKKVLVDVYTDWCRWCKVMDQKTFTDPALKQFLQKEYHLVKLNGEDPSTILFKGQNFSFVKGGRRGYNQLAATLLQGNLAYPSFVVLNEQLEVEEVIRGYKNAEAFQAALME